MTNSKLTLKEMLEHMHELATHGHYETPEFDQAHNLYIHELTTLNDRIEIRNAKEYLEGIDGGIGTLNIEFMIEELEDKLSVAM